MRNFSATSLASSGRSKCFYVLPLFLLMLVTIEGWWFGGDNGKVFTNSFALVVCILWVRHFVFTRFSIFVFLLSFFLLCSVVINFYFSPYAVLQKDMLFYLRSLVFGSIVYTYFYRSAVNGDLVFLRRVSLICWFLVTGMIFLSSLLGLGFYTYEEFSVGRKFYFPSVNELNFVYFVFNLMVWSFYKSLFFRLFIFIVGFSSYLVIGNKSFVALYLISFVSFFVLVLPFLGRIFLLFFCMICFSLFVLSPEILEFIFDLFFRFFTFIFGSLSGGAEKFLVKASYLSPFSVLVSERDVLYFIGHDIFFSEVDFFRILFGMSYGAYGTLYAARRGGDFSFSEIDPIDLFFSYGLTGVFIMMLLFAGLLSLKGGGRPRTILILLFFFAGLMTGHIYSFVFPVFFFAMYLGLLTPRVHLR